MPARKNLKPAPRQKIARKKEGYLVTGKAQLEALASAKRQVVLDIVSAHGPMTAKDLAAILPMSRTTLYQHLERLEAVGLIVESGLREGKKKPERLYATPARRIYISKAVANRANRDLIDQIVCATFRQAVADLRLSLDHPDLRPEGDHPNFRFARLSFKASDDKLRRVNRKIEEIKQILDGDDKGEGPLMSFVIAFSPYAVRGGD